MTQVNPIPEGMHSVTPQLIVEGADDALAFYEKAFGARVVSRAPDPSGKKVWHAAMIIGNSTVFVNDTFPGMGVGQSTARLWIYLPEIFEVADRIEVLRLGERVARLRPKDVSMEDVVSAMTGALSFHEEDER